MCEQLQARESKVLIIGPARNTRACLSALRSLGRRGLEVHLAIPEADNGPVLASRYLRQVHELPAYADDPQQWLTRVLELVRHEQFKAVFPVTDASVIPLQENRHKLGDLVDRFALLNEEAYRVSYNKQLSRELAIARNIPVAEGQAVDCADDALKFAARYGYPIIMKPLSSFTEDNLTSKQLVKTIYHPAGVRTVFEKSSKPYVLEQFFRGIGCGIEFLAKDGQLLYAFQHERVHEPMHGGGSSYRRSVVLQESLLAASRKLIEALGYTGIGMIEFKLAPETGKFKFIEINGRFWGSLPLSIAAGADFPAWLYAMQWEGRTHFSPGYRINRYCRNVRLDAIWFFRNLVADKSDPTLMSRPLSEVIKEFRHLFLGRENWDTWAWDDARPFFAEFYQLLGKR